ncbi:MAG: glycosyltransferase [Bacteroidota bacterium]
MATAATTEQYDIIYLGIFRWDGPFSSISIALAKEFAKHNRVFFLNHPYSIRDYLKMEGPQAAERKKALLSGKVRFEKSDDMPEKLVSVIPPLTLPINWLSPGKLYDGLQQYNDRQIRKAIEAILQKYEVKQYIFINCFDPFYGQSLPAAHPPIVHIYQCVDDIGTDDYIRKHGVRLEKQAVAKADVTTVTSNELYRICSQISDQVYVLNNAADIRIFQRAVFEKFPKPKELEAAKGKIIGYMGNLDNMRIDYPLLKAIATQLPEHTLLLIGPINNDEYKNIGLDQLPNVIMTGGKSIEALPPYLQYFDCALIPFLCNKITKSIYPLKINEYLAAGKAVVSTRFSVDIEQFEAHIYLADDHAQFVAHIKQAIQEDDAARRKQRLEVAGQNTWTARVQQFWEIVAPYLSQKHRQENPMEIR